VTAGISSGAAGGDASIVSGSSSTISGGSLTLASGDGNTSGGAVTIDGLGLKGLSPYLLTRDPGSSASSLAICLVL
jgi:hypothetical protein